MTGQPDANQRAQQLLKDAQELEVLSKGYLAGLTERTRANNNQLTPEDAAGLRQLVNQQQGRVQQLITAVLKNSAPATFRQSAPATRPDVTMTDDQVIPLPHPPTQPELSPDIQRTVYTSRGPAKSTPPRPRPTASYKPELPVPAFYPVLEKLAPDLAGLRQTLQAKVIGGNPRTKWELLGFLCAKQSLSETDMIICQEFLAVLSDYLRVPQNIPPPEWLKKAQDLKDRLNLKDLGFSLRDEFSQHGLRLIKKLGSGGMGVVFLAEKTGLLAKRAVKVVTDPEQMKSNSMNKEAILGAQFVNEPVVMVHSTGTVSGYPFLEMECVEGAHPEEGAFDGEKLFDLIRARPDFPAEARIIIAQQLAKAIGVLHRKGISHNDLKHGNYLLTPQAALLIEQWQQQQINAQQLVELLLRLDRIVILSDLGVASLIRDGELEDSNAPLRKSKLAEIPEVRESFVIPDGTNMGTPVYNSPEQANGVVREGRNDVYTWAILTFELLTGKRPIDFVNTTSPINVYLKILELNKEQPSAISVLETDGLLKAYPTEVRQVLSRASLLQQAWRERGDIDQAARELGEIVESYKPEVRAQRAAEARASQEAKKAGAAREVVAKKEKEVKSQRSRAEKEERRATEAEQKKRRVAGIGAVAAVGLLTLLGGVMVNNKMKRDAEQAAIRARDEARDRADRLIGEGEALMAQGQYDAARAKYREAASASPERTSVAEQKVVEANSAECGRAYNSGVVACLQGELDPARTAFARMQSTELNMSGLNQAQRTLVTRYAAEISAWPQKQAELEQRARTLVQTDPINGPFEELRQAAQAGDAEAITILLMARAYYKQLRMPAALRAQQDLSASDQAARVAQLPEVRRYFEVLNALKASGFEIARAHTGDRLLNPGDLTRIRENYVEDMTDCQRKLTDLLLRISRVPENQAAQRAALYRSYQEWLFQFLGDSSELTALHARLETSLGLARRSLNVDHTAQLESVLTAAQTQLPPAQQRSIMSAFTANEALAGDADLSALVRRFLGQ